MTLEGNNTDHTLDLILQRIRLYARRRIAWLRKLWSEEGESGGQLAVTHVEIDALLDNRDSRDAEYSWYESNPEMTQLNEEIKAIETHLKTEKKSRYNQLINIFKLSSQETDILQLCLAQRLDPSLSRVYAYLNDHAGRAYVTENLVARLFGYGHSNLWRKDSPLAVWDIVEEKEGAHGEPAMFVCDPFIVQWLQGENNIDPVIAGLVNYIPVVEPLRNWPVNKVSYLVKRIIEKETAQVRINISGSSGSGRKSLAGVISDRFKLRLMAIDSDRADDWQNVFMHSQRHALLNNYSIAWSGDKAMELSWLLLPLTPRLQFIICDQGQKPKPARGIIEYSFEMPDQPLILKQKLIEENIPDFKNWDSDKRATLLSQHKLNIGDVTALKERQVSSPEEATEIIRELSRNKLGALARLLECPFGWEDLVVPAFLKNSLQDFEFEARERKQFWENENARKLFPQGRGLIGLFSGPPGTGKTMAVQVIAAELGLDLYRIDLSSVVSKYVGETSQNLERILSRAANMDIVLLFDEADALFGKRTEVKDAHDRFANTDTNYLLQAIENYQGIAILASNKKENIDTAFIRRLRYVLEFPRPEAGQREQIWKNILVKLIDENDRQKLDGQIKILATHIEMTGAQIKFAALTGAFAARRDKKPVDMIHLMRGIDRELMKEGRALSKLEREKLSINDG